MTKGSWIVMALILLLPLLIMTGGIPDPPTLVRCYDCERILAEYALRPRPLLELVVSLVIWIQIAFVAGLAANLKRRPVKR